MVDNGVFKPFAMYRFQFFLQPWWTMVFLSHLGCIDFKISPSIVDNLSNIFSHLRCIVFKIFTNYDKLSVFFISREKFVHSYTTA